MYEAPSPVRSGSDRRLSRDAIPANRWDARQPCLPRWLHLPVDYGRLILIQNRSDKIPTYSVVLVCLTTTSSSNSKVGEEVPKLGVGKAGNVR